MEGAEPSSSTPPLPTKQDDDSDVLEDEDVHLAASSDAALEPRVNPIGAFLQFVWNREVLLRVVQKRLSFTSCDFVVN